AIDAESIELRPTLTVVFNEQIQKGTGKLHLVDAQSDTTLQSIPIILPEVTVSGATLTFPLSADLPAGKEISILIDAGAIKDVNDNNFAGIADLSVWHFKTGEIPQPMNIEFVTLPGTTAVENVLYTG